MTLCVCVLYADLCLQPRELLTRSGQGKQFFLFYFITIFEISLDFFINFLFIIQNLNHTKIMRFIRNYITTNEYY
jgi:hypothetical protein